MKAVIYCDETGSNGGDLLNKDQMYFGYGSFILNEVQITKISQTLKFKPEREEKKNINFLELLALVQENNVCGQVYIADKKLALCCNIFEWVIEEVLHHKNIDNSFWYTNNLHKGLANMLYISTIVNDKSVIWLDNFNSCLETGGETRGKKQQKSEKELLECNLGDFRDNPLVYAIIRLFKKYHSKSIFSPRKHQLDPSFASLFANISDLTRIHKITECEIYYDASKSITSKEKFLKEVVKEQKFISHRNDLKICVPKITNVNEVDSKQNMGIRIADILVRSITKEFLSNKQNLLQLKEISFNAILPESQEDMKDMIKIMHKYNVIELLLSL